MFGKKEVTEESKRTLKLFTSSKSFAYREAYKALRTNFLYAAQENNAKVIMVTSAIPGEGKSNVAVNLAVSLGQDGKNVVLIDCDLRKTTLQRYLGISRQAVGLSNVLNPEYGNPTNDVILHSEALNIDILCGGTTPENPSELIGSDRMGSLLRSLSKVYDYVICDSAPINIVTDGLALGRFVDGAVLVVSHNLVTKDATLSAKRQLEEANVPIIGCVLSQYDAKNASGKGYGYGYGYGYGSYSYYGSYGSYGYGYGETPEKHHSSKDKSDKK